MESRRMRSRSQALKWACYAAALFVCAALQTTPGLFRLGQAKPLLAIEDEKLQVKLANLIIERELSARKAEALVKKVLAGDNVIEQIEQVKEAKMYLNDVQERLKQILGTNVNIKQGKKKSRIEIEFYNDDDLARLVELLMEKQESPQMNKSRIIKDFNI